MKQEQVSNSYISWSTLLKGAKISKIFVLRNLSHSWWPSENGKKLIFFDKIEFLRANSRKMRQDSMNVSFEVVSTWLEDYLFIFFYATEFWRDQIMASENATFVKNAIFNKQYLPIREVVNTDENHFAFIITQKIFYTTFQIFEKIGLKSWKSS